MRTQRALRVPHGLWHDVLPDAVPVVNYTIGLLKGCVFGMLIALVSCHFGLRIQPNTESLGRGTTFHIFLPARLGAVVGADSALSAADATADRRVRIMRKAPGSQAGLRPAAP